MVGRAVVIIVMSRAARKRAKHSATMIMALRPLEN